MMRRVYVCSPLRGIVAPGEAPKIDENQRYARLAMRDALERGESPYVPHLLLTQVLGDDSPKGRELAQFAGSAWLAGSDALVVYADHGVSPGMGLEIGVARALRIPVEFRTLGDRG